MDLIPFSPKTFAKNPHIQTLLGEFTKVEVPIKPRHRKVLTLSDGDQIAYNVYAGTSDYVVTVGHGLTGSNRAQYIRSISSELNQRGHTVVAYNHRNCGDGFGLSRRTYHSGRSEDLGELIYSLKKEFPDKKQIAIGYSMSGNALLKLLGDPRHKENSSIALPEFAIAINAPINIGKTSSLLNRGVNRIYQYNFIRALNIYAGRLHSRGLLEKKYQFSNWLTSMEKFDIDFTGPESGYGTAQNYYDSCSAMNYLQHINTKTVIITAEDDPFVDSKDYEQAQSNPQIQLLMQKHGGHMGYIAEKKLPHGSHRWLDYAILKIIEKTTDQKHTYDHSSDAKTSNSPALQDIRC